MDSTEKDVIVYAWAAFNQRSIGARSLPSSMDTYGEEYGWTAHDFAMAAGGTLVNFYTVGIHALVPETMQDIPIAVRYEKIPNRSTDHETESLPPHPLGFATGYPADSAILFRRANRLIDIGLYGIFDTLSGERLAGFPELGNELLDFDGQFLFLADSRDRKAPIRFINLRDGILEGAFVLETASGERAERKSYGTHEGRLSVFYETRVLKPRMFSAGGKQYVIANAKKDDWYHVEKSSITDLAGNVLVKGDMFHKYIVDAIGFPSALIPQLAEHGA